MSSYKDIIDSCLQERSNEWPLRGVGYYKYQEQLKLLYCKLDKECWIDKNILKPDWIHNPVFIFGYMKSGTTLTLSLLDDHPNLLVMPGDTHIQNFWNAADTYSKNQYEPYWLSRMINPTGQEPYWFLPDIETLILFLSSLRGYVFSNPKEPLINAIVYAIATAKNKNFDDIMYWVEKTPANEYVTRKLNLLYPKSKFMHIIRHPVTNFYSSYKLEKIRKRYKGSITIADGIINSHDIANINKKTLDRDRYKIIKYEDITLKTNKVMPEIAKFLDIKYNNFLLIPSSSGQAASANSIASSHASKIKGVIHKKSLNTESIWEKLNTWHRSAIYNKWKKANNSQYIIPKSSIQIPAAILEIEALVFKAIVYFKSKIFS